MAVTEITKQMQAMLKEVVVAPLRERGFKGSFPDLRRDCGDRVDLIGFCFFTSAAHANMSFSVDLAPVFPGREPLENGANLDPIRSSYRKQLRVWSAWKHISLPGYFPEYRNEFFYGYVFKTPAGAGDGEFYSLSEKTLKYDFHKDKELILTPDEASYRKIAEEVKRQMDETLPHLESASCFQDWDAYASVEIENQRVRRRRYFDKIHPPVNWF